MANDVIVKNNFPEIHQKIKDAIRDGLEMAGNQCETYASELCPVDTSNLKNSITSEVQGDDTVIVGTDVEYATYVELKDSAHHKVGQAHFMRDAVNDHKSEYLQIIKETIKNVTG